MKPTLVVLAAGMGSRFGGLKQMEGAGPSGEKILDYSVHDALAAGFGKVVFVIRRDIESDFRAHVSARFRGRLQFDHAFQEPGDLPAGFTLPSSRKKPLGTAHAIYAARKHVHENFAVINADDFYGRASFTALAGFLSTAGDHLGVADWALVGYGLGRTLSESGAVSRGLCRADESGFLQSVTEIHGIVRQGAGIQAKDPADPSRTVALSDADRVSMNCWAFTPSIFGLLETGLREFVADPLRLESGEYQIPSVVTGILEKKRARVKVLNTPESWIGITYREDLASAKASLASLVEKGVYPTPLFP